MRRFFKYGQILTLGLSILLSIATPASATDNSWVKSSIMKISDVPATWPTAFVTSCSGTIGLISVKGWPELQEACIYGKSGGVQIAKYGGGQLYAVAFALDASYTQLRDPCSPGVNCMYGQLGDTLLIQVQKQNGLGLALLKDFSKQLVKHKDDIEYYRYEGAQEWRYISFGSRGATTGSMTVSPNGRWGAVELIASGFVRIDLQTLEYKRVVAPSGEYGYGMNPIYELAITNDGTKLAVAGWNSSIAVYEIDDECGDTLKDTSTANFSPYTYACKRASIDTYGMFPGFKVAQAPKFTEQGTRLSIYVYANNQARFVWLGPEGMEVGSSEPLYVAFGDSFSSGEGETSDAFYLPSTNTAQNRCHVSSRSYPFLVGNAWNIDTVNKACSGSRTEDVKLAAIDTVQGGSSLSEPSLISIGVGGNDIELMGKLKTCLAVGQCEWVSVEKRRANLEEIKALFPKIVELIMSIKLEYAESQLALVGYPSVVNTTAASHCTPLVSTLLSKEERRYMDESIKYLNQVLKAAASYTKTIYIDVENALIGERLCEGSEQAMNSVRLGDDIAPLSFLSKLKLIGAESFHPTPRGHQLITAAIRGIANSWEAINCGDCHFDPNQLVPTEYWEEGDKGIIRSQKAENFLSTTEIGGGKEVLFHFAQGTFLAGSRVILEMHSEVTHLGEYTVKDDGSLSGAITIPRDLEGYHTLHAYGTSQSGVEYDLYQIVTVGSEEAVQFTTERSESNDLFTQQNSPHLKQKSSNHLDGARVLGDATVAMTLPPKLTKNTTETNNGNNRYGYDLLPGLVWVAFILLAVGGVAAGWMWLQNRRVTD